MHCCEPVAQLALLLQEMWRWRVGILVWTSLGNAAVELLGKFNSVGIEDYYCYLCTYIYICICIYLEFRSVSISISILPSIHPAIHPPIYLSTHLSIYLPTYHSINQYNSLSIYLFFCPSIDPSIHLSNWLVRTLPITINQVAVILRKKPCLVKKIGSEFSLENPRLKQYKK